MVTSEITVDLVVRGLTACRMKHLKAWTQATLVSGVHVTRSEDLTISPEEENLRKLMPAPTPSF